MSASRPGKNKTLRFCTRYDLKHFLQSGLDTITCLVSATDGHSRANVGKTISEALVEAGKLIDAAKLDGITVRAYISMAFGCPIDGATDPQQVQDILEAYVDMGADTIILADTIGTGKPEEVCVDIQMRTRQ